MSKVIEAEWRNNKHIIYDFPSYDDFLTTLEQSPIHPDVHKPSSQGAGRSYFYGTSSWEEAINYASYGWPEGREKLEAELESNIEERYTRLPANGLDVAGSYPIVPVFVAGDDVCMMNPIADSKMPTVSIFMNQAFSAMVDESVITHRGGCVVKLIEDLETMGISCQLNIGNFNKGDGVTFSSRIPVKNFGEHFDFDRVAFCAINPSFQRRCKFRLQEIVKHKKYLDAHVIDEGYGVPCEAHKFFLDKNEYDIYIPGSSADSVNFTLDGKEYCWYTWNELEVSKLYVRYLFESALGVHFNEE